MVIQDFLDYINKFNFIHTCGVYDIFDRCVYILTFSIILICSATITIKSYILEPMSCYIPTTIGGSNVIPYVNNYCWIIGTFAKNVHEHDEDNEKYWSSLNARKITYYQWVPFVLGLQAAMLYVPYVFWECLVYNRLGTNIQFIIDIARKASLDNGKGRQTKISQMAGIIFLLLTTRKKRCEKPSRLSSHFSFYKMEIVFYYLLLKLTSIVIILTQFLVMERFLGMQGRYRFFGITLLQDLINGSNWDKTHLFPRMAFCRVPFKMANTPQINLQAQCSLSINILNEKIFIFLWWWFGMVAVLQAIGFILWVYRCLPRQSRIYLIEHSVLVQKSSMQHLHKTVEHLDSEVLSVDGSFLIQMTRLNCGDLICNELIDELLKAYSNSKLNSRHVSFSNDLSPSSSVDLDKDYDKSAFI